MKNSLVYLYFSFCILLSNGLYAADEKYLKAMEENLTALGKAVSVQDFQKVANRFEQIAGMKSTEWLPNYWAAYTMIRMSFVETDAAQKDKILEEAEKFLKKAQAQESKNDEVLVLEAYLAQARLVIDPMNRWQTQGGKFSSALEKARALNTHNPRIYLLEGQDRYNTPEQFGGGKEVACPILNTALEKFSGFKAVSEIHPKWGQRQTENLLKNCKG